MSDDPYMDAISDNRSAQVIQVESSKLAPLIIVLAIVSGFAIAMAMFAFYTATIAEREARMSQYRTDGLQKQLVANGFPDPGDDYSWYKAKPKENAK